MATWSGIKNKLENDYLCPALRGRIQYFVTRYHEAHDQEGRAAIRLDGEEVLRSNYYDYRDKLWNRFNLLRDEPNDYQLAYESTLNDGCFDQRVFYHAFHIFDNQSIEESINSDNPLVRVLALLDRRLGKRRLLTMKEKMEQELPWVRAFYTIRMQAEGLVETEDDPHSQKAPLPFKKM